MTIDIYHDIPLSLYCLLKKFSRAKGQYGTTPLSCCHMFTLQYTSKCGKPTMNLNHFPKGFPHWKTPHLCQCTLGCIDIYVCVCVCHLDIPSSIYVT